MKKIFLFVLILFFNIGASNAQCTTRIYLYDTYSDGWDGAYLDVYLDDVWQYWLECPSGNSGVYYTVVVPDGQTLSVAYTPGSYESEHAYGVDTNLDGTFEFADGYGPAYMGFTYSYSCGAIDPCKVYVQMYDSAEDGWNGGYLTCDFDNVQQGGNISVEAADYASNVEMYTVPSCVELSLTYTAGSWETENYYWVYRNGVYEFSDLIEPSPGNSYNYYCSGVSSASTFYSKSSGNLNELSTWGENIDGTGCPPANFTTAGVTYNVHNNTAPTTSGAWAVSGAGSKVVFGDPDVTVSFTAGGALDFDCDIEIANDGTLNLNDNNMNLAADLIRSSATAVFNPGPSGTNTVTFDGGTDQYVNVTTAGGSTPADADLTFYDVVVNNNSAVRLYYKFSNSKKLNINDLNVNSGSTLHFISD
jgi:hypothetical protein